MSMLKVGDRVRESLSGVTGVVIDVSRLTGCAVVHMDDPSKGIHHEAFPGKNVYMLPNGMFELIAPAEQEKPVSKILITTDGKTTLARLYEDNKVVKRAEAKCAPGDEFKFEIGANLAFDRLMGRVDKFESKPEPEQPQYYNGKVVCVDDGDSTAWQVGKVYTFENGRTVNSEGRTSPYNRDWIKSFEHLTKVFSRTMFIEFKGENTH